VSEFDPKLCDATLQRLAATGVYYVPTHVTREMEARASDPAYRSDPSRQYIAAERNARWEADLQDTAKLPADEQAALERFYKHGLTVTGLAHRAGVPIMAGTDLNDTMIVPGFSLHRELALLQAAGLSNMAVLRAATTTPAAYLKRNQDLGGISAGKEADLVLLAKNPLTDIRNTQAIVSVISDGRVFTRGQLDGLLKEVRLEVAPLKR
jgi:imidazolonepropionase-like amidohydrolase